MKYLQETTVIVEFLVAMPLLASSLAHEPVAGASAMQVQPEIRTIGRGVARKREGTVRLFCADAQWAVSWRSDVSGRLEYMEIVFIHGEDSRVLFEAAQEIMSRIEDFEGPSATCNTNGSGALKSSYLLLPGYDRAEGTPLYANVESTNTQRGYTIYWIDQ